MSIKIDEVNPLLGQAFRVSEFERPGVCKRSIWCRVDWHDDDWRVQLFDSHRGANQNWEPMDAVSTRDIDLAIAALEQAKKVIADAEAERGA